MVKNSLLNMLPFLLAADLMIPFLLAPTYRGYNHLARVMRVLESAKAPLRLIYNIWLVVFGAFALTAGFRLYLMVAKISRAISILLFSVMAINAICGCILSGFFSVGERKSLETISAKIHGYGSAIGFFVLFIMADKSHYQGTVIAFEGLRQRLSLLSMHLPTMALCILRR